MEKLEAHDLGVLGRLGYAVARAQLFELALLKLLEAQRHDVTAPLEDRWPEIEKWLTTKTAGSAARALKLPEVVAADLKAVVGVRNVVAHHAWRFYLATRERKGESAASLYETWFDDQARIMGVGYNATMALVTEARKASLDATEAERVWRSHFPTSPTQPEPPS